MQKFSDYKIRIKTAAITVSTLVLALCSAALPASALEMGGPSDCDANAVIRCGTHSTLELKHAYKSDPYVQDVYNGFGISSQDIHNIGSTSVSGKVTNRGNVYVDSKSKPVATGAMTAGRTNMSGSNQTTSGSSTYYKRPTGVSMQRPSLPAYVVMDSNGQFKYAVIASCGNPVIATPVTPAPKPTPPAAPQQPTPQPPTPAPVQNQQQQQQQQQQQVVVNNTTVNQAPDTSTVPTETTPSTNATTAQSQQQNQAQQQGQQQQQSQTQTAPVTQPTTTTETTPVVTTTTQPQAQATALPNTGAAGVIVLFVLSSAAGFYWYRKYLTHIMSQ
jgi:hypothetical protein